MTKSCLVAKLSHYIELTAAEARLLAELEEASESYERRDTILSEGAPFREIFVVKTGWVYGHTVSSEGNVLIAEIACPGDVVGVGQVAVPVSNLTYVAATGVVICPFPKVRLRTLFDEHPRLIALFFAFATLEHATLIDRLRAMSQMSARDNIALFLLQTRARLKVTGHAGRDTIELPLSQELIGNTVGLSIVSVNRALRLLEEEGRIERDGRMIRFRDADALARELDFNKRHYLVDGDWLPASR